jgi:valyl-tRNA synthetase
VWGEVADAYIELSKAGLRDERRRASTLRTLAYVLDRVLRLLHPITPFITETLALQLWRAARYDGTSLVIARWPEAGGRDESLERRMEVALEVVRAARALRQEAAIEPGERVRVTLSGETAPVGGALDVIAILANADVAIADGAGPAKAVGAIEVRLAAKRDARAEHARIQRELADARAALQRSEELLAKPGFADRAPKPVVHKERARLEERRAQVHLLEDELTRLGE